jgi:hypothetical protein
MFLPSLAQLPPAPTAAPTASARCSTSTSAATSAAEKKLYTGGEVEAEMAEPQKREDEEQARERAELYPRSDEETDNGNE